MKKIYIEKRKCRSNNIVEALELYFKSLVERSHLNGIILSDNFGLVVAGFYRNSGNDVEEIAAVCPLIFRVNNESDYLPKIQRNHQFRCGDEVSILLFLYSGQPLYLVAIDSAYNEENVSDGKLDLSYNGEERTDVRDTLISALHGVIRILGNNY